MNKEQFEQKLEDISACSDARSFCKGKTIEEAWAQCERGDWMLWLYRRASNYDLRKFTFAKGYCAATVKHLMKDERSIKAVEAAIAFGNGEIELADLEIARSNAAAAYAAAYAAAAAYSAAAAAADARKTNRMETADICRKYLPIPIFE